MTAELSFDVYVEAADYASAAKLARGAIRDELGNYTSQDWDVHGKSTNAVDSEWADGLPYGGDGMKTVADYLKEQADSNV